MTKILKKIMLICCSFLFVFCLSIGGLFGLNTMSAKAATDITFNSIAWNNIEYAYEYGPTGTLLLYNGGKTAITDVDTNLTAELGDKITIDGTPISSMKLTVSPEVLVESRPVSNGNAYLLIRYEASYAKEGAILHFQEAMAGNANFPELKFKFTNGAWVKMATPAQYLGISHNMADVVSNGRLSLGLQFNKPLSASANNNLCDGNQLNITLDGKAINTANLPPRCYTDIKDYTIMQLLFKNALGSLGTYAEGVQLQSGTKLEIKDSVVNGYAIPNLAFSFNGETKTWSEIASEPTTPAPEEITFVKIDENINHYADGEYFLTDLKFSFDTTTNAQYIWFGTAQEGYEDLASKIYWTAYGETAKNSFNIVFGVNGNIRLMDHNTRFPTAYATIHIEEGTVIEGKTLPATTLYVNAEGKWTTEVQTPPEQPKKANYTGIVEGFNFNNYYADRYVLALGYDQPMTSAAVNNLTTVEGNTLNITLNGKAAIIGDSNLSPRSMKCGGNATNPNSIELVFMGYGANGTAYADGVVSPFAHGTKLEIKDSEVNGYTLEDVTLYFNASTQQWSKEEVGEPTPEEITFVKIDDQINHHADGEYFLTDLKFSFDTTTNAQYIWFGTAQEGYENLAEQIYWTAYGETAKHSFNIVFGMNGNIRLMDHNTRFPTAYATIHIEEGTVIEGKTLPATTLYVNAEGKWTTEVQTPPETPDEPDPEVETANFERVAGCVMDGSIWGMHSILYVKFDKALAPKTTSIHGTGQANNSGNLKDKMTIGGNAIAMGSQINFYVNTFYSAEGTNTTILEIMFANATASNYTKGTVLHIPEGTLFGDVALSEVTLTFNGATWVDETKLTRVEFIEIDADRNNNNVWGMNYVTILYFDKPLYEGVLDTTLAEQVAGDLGANLTLNGVTAKELGVAITFASLSQEGRYGLEIHIPVAKMLKFSEELTQIILKIEAETIFLNNILPELTFYLNEESKWQTDEFIYVYIPPMEVELTGVSFRYNNDNNTWQTEGEWYLSVFEFSDFLSKTEIKGNSLPLGDKITLNGVKTSELGFIFGISAYGTSMNVQYPKAALLSILDAPRIELALAEPVEYGDSIIKPFRLYLNKQAIKWELIDGTDTTAPQLNYTGATEITTSAEKPFVIDVSAFDTEDNKEAAIYYVWSEGALDESGKLVKGSHTCTVVAVDKSGNESKLELTVNVGDKDTSAPVISVPDTISAVEGAIPQLTYKAADDTDGEILCEIAWSEGALDENGKLVAGTHTMTLTATDLTGNTSTKTVTVNVEKVDVPVDSTEPDDSTTPDDSTDSSDVPSTSDTPTSSQPSSGGCFGSIDASSAIILLALVVGVSALRFIKRKNSEDKE